MSARRARLARLLRSPLGWILGAVLVLHAIGIGWGLPASDGWDVDGVAPRDVLAGLVETFTPGHFYTYPPVHLILVGILTSPVTLIALAHAPSLAPRDVVHEVIQVPYMTAIAAAARAVSVGMSLGIVWAVAKMAEELRGERAGWCAAAFVGVNVPLTYYAHTSNLDVPYVLWSSLALLALVRAVARHEPRRLRSWGVLAALAVGTKDQAFALFVLGVPAGLLLAAVIDDGVRRQARAFSRELALGVASAAGILLVVDGVLVNPSGFRERLRFLVGPASQSYAEYTADWTGRWHVVKDLATRLYLFYPWAFAGLMLVGLVVVLRAREGEPARKAAGLLPLAAIVSFTLAFNCAARRTDQRFELPQAVLLAVYGGIGLDALVFRPRSAGVRGIARLAAVAAFAFALFAAADVDANLLFDPRYDAEAWMRDHVTPGDVIETYGQNVYMPRFPPAARVVRVGPSEADHRNPMPGVEEVLAPFEAASGRGARFIVVSEGWAWRYLIDPEESFGPGRMLAPTQRETITDGDATRYFQALTQGRYGSYRLVHASGWPSKVWPPLVIHASTSRDIWIYERAGAEGGSP